MLGFECKKISLAELGRGQSGVRGRAGGQSRWGYRRAGAQGRGRSSGSVTDTEKAGGLTTTCRAVRRKQEARRAARFLVRVIRRRVVLFVAKRGPKGGARSGEGFF